MIKIVKILPGDLEYLCYGLRHHQLYNAHHLQAILYNTLEIQNVVPTSDVWAFFLLEYEKPKRNHKKKCVTACGTWTHNPRLRRPMLYPIKLRPLYDIFIK